jgi:hypothetical protein
MTKLEDLIATIDTLPDDCELLKFRIRSLISHMEIDRLVSYVCGVKDAMELLTSDEAYLAPVRKTVELLK